MPHAFVTGTSMGLGRLAAEGLVALGWTVTGAMRDPAKASGDEAWETLPLDLTDQATIDAAVARIAERSGGLDALISNAGVAMWGPWEELTSDDLRLQLEVNLVGTMALVRGCLPHLRAAGGVIVQVSSVSGQEGEELNGAYNASKFALEGASEALAKELAPQGVRVVIVEPGAFRTTILETSPQASGRGSTGLYDEQWRELLTWNEWFRTSAEDPRVAAAAIVAAATRPDAPFRIPVGTEAGGWVREHAQGVIEQVEQARVFLEASRAARP
jgi:NAD(P)-dependent dehydrogenase (short-subunit alcohol dehydrogenase family)